MIPQEDRGYAVDRSNSIVHKRYADHASHLPKTSYRGVMATVTDPQPCETCWPPEPDPVGYFCDRCNRTHYPGTAVYERHQQEPAPHDEQPAVELVARSPAEEASSSYEPPYFPPYGDETTTIALFLKLQPAGPTITVPQGGKQIGGDA